MMEEETESNASGISALVRQALEAVKRRRFGIGFLLGSGVTGVVGAFILQNRDSTRLHLFWVDFDAPLWLFLLATFVAGAVGWELFHAAWRRLRRTAIEARATEAGVMEAARIIDNGPYLVNDDE
jgi:uncharacterized integral membrane protein